MQKIEERLKALEQLQLDTCNTWPEEAWKEVPS